jgi:hypothetical protein
VFVISDISLCLRCINTEYVFVRVLGELSDGIEWSLLFVCLSRFLLLVICMVVVFVVCESV